jgi:hypothetical protein
MSEVELVKPEPQYAAFIAIDWADKKHVWCLQGMGSEKRDSGELEHTPEAVEAWVVQQCQRFGTGSDRGGGGAIAGSTRVHAEQV